MTVTTTTNRMPPYAGDGSQTIFPFTFKIFVNTDLRVYLTNVLGVKTLLTLTTHYSVSGAGSESGGNVTMVTPPATGETLTIIRQLPLTQETDYTEADKFPAQSHENALDRQTMISQQLDDKFNRVPILSEVTTKTSVVFPENISGYPSYLRWNAAGSGLELATVLPSTGFDLEWIDARSYGASLTGATLAAAIAANPNGGILYVSHGSWLITSDLTIPANITLKLERGAIFSIADGMTLTINGSLEAGLYQIFSCTGTGKVLFGDGAVKEGYLEWWGGKGDDLTDNYAPFSATLKAGSRISILDGIYRIVGASTPIYLNAASLSPLSALKTYGILGNGWRSHLSLYNFTNQTYLLVVNEDPTTGNLYSVAGNRFPALKMHDLWIDALKSTTPNLAKLRYSQVDVQYCFIRGFTNGFVTGTEYCEPNLLKDSIWRPGVTCGGATPTGYLWVQNGYGDGTVLDHIYCSAPDGHAIDMHNCGLAYFGGSSSGAVVNGKITNCVGGMIYLEQTENFIIDNQHSENVGAGHRALQAKHAQFTLKNSWIQNNYDAATEPILIEGSNGGTTIFQNNNFSTRLLNPYGAAAPGDIRFGASLGGGQTIILHHNQRLISSSGGGGAFFATVGIRATAADSALNTALTTYPGVRLLSGDVAITYHSGAMVWGVSQLNNEPIRLPLLGTPGLVTPTVETWYYSNLAAGTYYYRLAYYVHDDGNGFGLHSAATTVDVSQTVSANQALKLSIGNGDSYVVARIWRGTASGVYDHYVDIPVIRGATLLYDCGDHVSGFPWLTANIPGLPASNTTLEGLLYPNGLREFWAAALPASGEFLGVKGDDIKLTLPSDGASPGSVCVSSVATTMRVQAVATNTILEVVSTTGMIAGQTIGVVLDNGAIHSTTIASITDADTLVLTAAIPTGRTANIGAAVKTFRLKAKPNLAA